MKKFVLGIALLTAMTCSFGTSAQEKKVCDKTRVECQDLKCYGSSRDYEGIDLTEDQKGRIQALNTGFDLSKKELLENAKVMNQTVKVNLPAEMRQLRLRYLKDMKQILTNDQYVQYLTNYFANNPANRPGKHGKPGRAEKCDAGSVSCHK